MCVGRPAKIVYVRCALLCPKTTRIHTHTLTLHCRVTGGLSESVNLCNWRWCWCVQCRCQCQYKCSSHLEHAQYLGQLAFVWHELVCAMQAIMPVQLHDGSKSLSTFLTANGTAFYWKVDTAQIRVEFPLATRITTQHLTPVTCFAMCHQVAPWQVRVAA